MKIQKSVLDLIITKDDIQLLTPISLISLGQEFFSIEGRNTFKTSINTLWTIATNGQRKLTKKEREVLIQLFEEHLGRDGLDFNELIDFTKIEDDSHYVFIHLIDVAKIFVNSKRIESIGQYLFFVINIYSYLNANYVYKSKEFIIQEFKHDYIGDDVWDETKKETWFRNYTFKDLMIARRCLMCYPTLETITTKRCNSDNVGFDEPIMSRSGVTYYLDRLSEWGLLYKNLIKWNNHGNKLIFCRGEHKEIVEELCLRLDQMEEYVKENKEE